MSVKYRVIPRRNPQNLLALPKFYAIASSDGLVGLDRLSKIIADGSTVRQNDVYAVLIGFVNAIEGELSAGRSVKIDRLGVFSIGLTSDGANSEAELFPSSIKKVRVRYRSSLQLKKMLKNLSFVKIPGN